MATSVSLAAAVLLQRFGGLVVPPVFDRVALRAFAVGDRVVGRWLGVRELVVDCVLAGGSFGPGARLGFVFVSVGCRFVGVTVSAGFRLLEFLGCLT